MKKHPVDDLFQKRLTSIEKKPTERAWARIQEGQKSKSRRVAGWVWYAAASVMLTMITGYLVWQDQRAIAPTNSTLEMANVEKARPDTVLPKDSPAGKDTSAEKKQVAQAVAAPVPVLTAVRGNSGGNKKGSSVQNQVPENKPEQLPQIAQIETVKPNEVKLDQPDIQHAQVPEKVIPKPVALAGMEEKKPDRTIIVEIEESVNDTKEKAKPSRFARVFRQLKNVREAEPVDWDDIGFNPKNIMARADDRTNADEKISGKRERKN